MSARTPTLFELDAQALSGAARMTERSLGEAMAAKTKKGNVEAALDRAAEKIAPPRISKFYEELSKAEQPQLLGYLMSIGYVEGTVITNDFYKMRAGGVSKNSFVLIVPNVTELPALDDSQFPGLKSPAHLILGRVLEPAPTPLASDVSRTYFELHKSHMPEIDVFTRAELQWSAMRISVLGTFYDEERDGAPQIIFGNDVETFWSPHMYTVHAPTTDMLEVLVNCFVSAEDRRQIGEIRFTETQLVPPVATVPVFVAPRDFVGTRTALFGKTRTGKSNTVKVIAQMVMESEPDIGQVIFDPNGEYAYTNEQDQGSIYDQFPDKCVRYTLRSPVPAGFRPLRANFYEDLPLAMHIIRARYEEEHGKPPDYVRPFLDWEPLDESEENELRKDSMSAWTRYQRQKSIYKCLISAAGFKAPAGTKVKLHLKKEIREKLHADGKIKFAINEEHPLDEAAAVYRAAWTKIAANDAVLSTTSGDPYFDETAASMLTILAGQKQGGTSPISGIKKFFGFAEFHDTNASKVLQDITEAVDLNKTVIVDLSNASEQLVDFFGELIGRRIFLHQMERFTANKLGTHYVQLYFEEAHVVFPRDDSNIKSNIYNRLVKEGAKLHIGVVYSTQSIATLSRDLLKNTENFFIAHLNDEGEIRELTRFDEFRDVGPDVQRNKTQGFVRMITASHKFALPVQIKKFVAESAKKA